MIAMGEMGFDSLQLMETASSKIATYINRHYTYMRDARILVLAGVGKPEKASREFLYQMFYFQKLNGWVELYLAGDKLPDSDVLIDGIFGIGLHRPVESVYKCFIE